MLTNYVAEEKNEKEKIRNFSLPSIGCGCGGCEIAVLDVDEKILDVIALFDILWVPLNLIFRAKRLSKARGLR
jgi:coenzyme F420-reducing hydrogenase gamma subunit